MKRDPPLASLAQYTLCWVIVFGPLQAASSAQPDVARSQAFLSVPSGTQVSKPSFIALALLARHADLFLRLLRRFHIAEPLRVPIAASIVSPTIPTYRRALATSPTFRSRSFDDLLIRADALALKLSRR